MDRKDLYKHKVASDEDNREKRRHFSTEIRKEKRDEILSPKRFRHGVAEVVEELSIEQVHEASINLVKKSGDKMKNLQIIRKGIAQGTALIDNFLSVDNSMSTLVGLLTGSDTDLQLEAAWCLTNVAAGMDTHSKAVLKDAGPYLVTYLSSGNTQLQDQCAWTIGNIAGGSAQCRETLLAQGVLPPLILMLKSPLPPEVQSAGFALSNLARDKTVAKELVDMGVLAALNPLLRPRSFQPAVMAELCWVVTYISASGAHEKAILEGGILDKLITMASHISSDNSAEFQMLTPLLRSLGNILSGGEAVVTHACKDGHLLPALHACLKSPHRHVVKEALWVLSNASVVPCVSQEMVKCEMLPYLVPLLNSAVDIKKEALYTLCHIASAGQASCEACVQQGALTTVVKLLRPTDVDLAHIGLSLVETCCRFLGQTAVEQFEAGGGLTALEALEYHSNDLVRTNTNHILDTYIYKPEQLPESM